MNWVTRHGFGPADDRRALARALLLREGVRAGATTWIEPHEDQVTPPLSPAQQMLWLFERTFPGTAAYNVPSVVRLTGPLDHRSFERSLDAAIRRHSVLRAVFTTDGARPTQRILPHSPRPLPVYDVTTFDIGAREQRAMTRVRREIAEPFDLARGPLVRARLIKLGDHEHLFVLTMHHIVGDAWSGDVLLQEMAATYRAFRANEPSPLPPLSIQYGDVARWQRNELDRDAFTEQLAYWRARLADQPPVLELPSDRPRPAKPSFRGSSVRFAIPTGDVAALRRICASEQATLFAAVLAAFIVLLHRYTERTDIIVAAPVANRGSTQVEPLVGVLVNTVLIRATVTAMHTFRDVLRTVALEAANALAHQDVPFESVVEELRPTRSLWSSPYSQVMLTFRSAPAPAATEGLEITHVSVHNGTAKRDLTLHLVDGGDLIEGQLEFDSDLFDRVTMERMAGHCLRLISACAGDPEQPVGSLPMLTDDDRRIIRKGTATAKTFPRANECVHRIFEAQTVRTPRASAVRDEAGSLTYQELNQRANQLAHRLRQLGVCRELPVGICMANSVEMVVAVLAVLKAGGLYVPVDPRDPIERRHAIMRDSKAGIVIVAQASAEQWADHPGPVIGLDRSWAVLNGQPTHDVTVDIVAANAAYLLYTSGSTGKPKGVVVEHRQLVNYLDAIVDRYGMDQPLSYLMLQPLTVDSCQTMLVTALCTGGELHLAAHARALDAGWLADYCREHAIDCLKIAPAHLRVLQTSTRFAELLPRRLLVVGGEASDWRWMREVQRLAEPCRVYNHYGPTETTVGVLTLDIRDHEQDHPTTALGTPIANTRPYILDRNGQLLPAGLPGELYIGGANVARGYHGKPDITASVFVPDPFGDELGARLYRTGDIARWRDGVIEFLGRRDDQVKIRGFRVEPGELESVLETHPEVRQAVVAVREADTPDERRLVAYVVPESPGSFAGAAVRTFLRERLPQHLLPSALVTLAELPLTPHGKVNRRALPAGEAMTMGAAPEVRPRTKLERQIAEIWKRLLQIDQVGVDQNFFDLGGYSLLVVQLHQELQEMVDRRFELIELFQFTTVRAQSDFLTSRNGTAALGEGKERGRRQSELMKRRARALRAERGQP